MLGNFFQASKDVDIVGEDELDLEVLRYSSGADSTLGLLFENGPNGREFLAYTLEDEWRAEKVSAETRIPAGTYDIQLRTVDFIVDIQTSLVLIFIRECYTFKMCQALNTF